MSSFVNICKFGVNSSKRYNRIAVNDMKTSVKTLSELVSKEFELTEDKFDLMCFGKVLNWDKTLDSYEITNGTTVWVINKTNLFNRTEKTTEDESEAIAIKPNINQSEVQHMVIALKTALMNASFRQMLDKLSEPEFRENLIAVTPGLKEDPTVMAILQDPDLLSHLTDPINIPKVLERHPCLLEAATFLSATFHEETIANESTSGPSGSGLLRSSSSNFSYSLDAMSDDEDMDDSEPSGEPNASTSSTAQRIAELMVRAYQSNQNPSSSSNSSNSSATVITHDMLRHALSQSSSQTSLSQPSPPVSTGSSQPSTPTVTTGGSSGPSVSARMRMWATQIQQLRDLGINDDIIALQALEATDGDVQAAINIIFSDNN